METVSVVHYDLWWNLEVEALATDRAASRPVPLGRLGNLEDIMRVVVFLASPASALVADGGWNAW